MKTLLLILTFLCFSSANATSLPLFTDLPADTQSEVIYEVGAAPVIVSDISELALGMDEAYVAMVKINDQMYSFKIFIFYGTQGTVGTILSDLQEVNEVPTIVARQFLID